MIIIIIIIIITIIIIIIVTIMTLLMCQLKSRRGEYLLLKGTSSKSVLTSIDSLLHSQGPKYLIECSTKTR